LVESKKKTKYNYRSLSPGEIKKLKRHGHEPHELKPKKHGSKYDLFKCKASGKTAIGRKLKLRDKEGESVYQGGDEFEDTGMTVLRDTMKVG